ncbi:MAG: BolA family protein [Pseudomonadota bacterium]
MGMVQTIEDKLRAAFTPSHLSVIDESEAHRGHAGFQEGGESHFRVEIASDLLNGKTRLAKHRAVYAALGPDVMDRIHALALTIR